MNLFLYLILAFCKEIKEIYDLCLFETDTRKEHVLINSHFLIKIELLGRQWAKLLWSWLLTKFSISFSVMSGTERGKLWEWLITAALSTGKIKSFLKTKPHQWILWESQLFELTRREPHWFWMVCEAKVKAVNFLFCLFECQWNFLKLEIWRELFPLEISCSSRFQMS